MIPRKIHLDKPAIVMELKWNKNAEGAIQQIKDKEYIDALKDENQEEISNFFLIFIKSYAGRIAAFFQR